MSARHSAPSHHRPDGRRQLRFLRGPQKLGGRAATHPHQRRAQRDRTARARMGKRRRVPR
eukprot:4350373-Pleurochrysis_carterae.AAC.1